MRSVRTPGCENLALLLGALAIGCGPELPPLVATSPRSVILLTADTLRADQLGAYGATGVPTPNLDALAARGQRVERAYTPFPKTAPALASLMTGRYPAEHSVQGNGFDLPGAEQTLAELLERAGYRTAAFVSSHVVKSRYGLVQGFDHYDDTLPDPVKNRDMNERTAGALVDAVEAKLETGAEPLFLWVHFIDPHGPYTPPDYLEIVRKLSETGEGARELRISEKNYVRGKIPAYQALEGIEAPAVYEALYQHEIAFMDEQIGRLMTLLRARGVLDDALVIFTADHGEALGEQGYYFQHGNSLLEAELRIPLLFAGPGVAPGARAEPMSLIDVLPTVLAFVGLPAQDGVSGQAIDLARLAPEAPSNRRLLAGREGESAVYEGHNKFIVSDGKPNPRLYDILGDPLETRNLADALPAWAEPLVEAAAKRPEPGLGGDEEAVDAETAHMLRALGYTD